LRDVDIDVRFSYVSEGLADIMMEFPCSFQNRTETQDTDFIELFAQDYYVDPLSGADKGSHGG
jgi:hypothetical protein